MGKKAVQADLQKLADMKINIDVETEKYDQLKEKILKQMVDNEIDIIRDNKDDSLTVMYKKVENRIFNIETVKAVLGADAGKCIKESVQAKAFDEIIKEKGFKGTDCFTTIPGTPQLAWGGLKEYKAKAEKK
jgi:hypothetical protein